jgi:cysteinyl-tRNA synthetase
MIRIHDSLAKKSVSLETREPGRVFIYLCGPTVYNYIHVGNARTVVWFDLFRKYLAYRGFDVTFVMNYTDVDDKIIERSKLEGVPADGITSKYSKAFEEDMAALGVAPPDILCRATDHIGEMIEGIQGLISVGVAYQTGGDVFFAVEKFPSYGKLSGRSLEDMRAGDRIEPHAGKRHPVDFALWKAAKEGEPAWDSPWGPGRPGWHIECSVMSVKYLGMGFDLHGGASDLIFPHHENEIAQAEALYGDEPFVRHWLHAGLVQMESEKMSKSLGNFVLTREAVKGLGGEPLRYWCLMGSLRSQVAFSDDAVDDASAAYERWRTFHSAAAHALAADLPERPDSPTRPIDEDETLDDGYVKRFVAAMDDDLNSAEAFAVVHDLVREGNRRLEEAQRGDEDARKALIELTATFMELTSVLGFHFEVGISSGLVSDLVDYLLELREQARSEKAFERADQIRARLGEMGVTIEDTPAGPRWRRRAGSP